MPRNYGFNPHRHARKKSRQNAIENDHTQRVTRRGPRMVPVSGYEEDEESGTFTCVGVMQERYNHTDEELAFLKAVLAFRYRTGKRFLELRDHLTILKEMGYEKRETETPPLAEDQRGSHTEGSEAGHRTSIVSGLAG